MASTAEDVADLLREVLEYHGAPVESISVVDRRRVIVELSEET